MIKHGPIIIIEDDLDDQELLREVMEDLQLSHLLQFFNSCIKALDYLIHTMERPFLIISDINLPAMTGMQLKTAINNNEYLRKKNIPFVFLSTTSNQNIVENAYELNAHGFFVKPSSMSELKEMLKMIFGYWKAARHPGA